MNTRLHDILDGDWPEGKGKEEDLFQLPEEQQEFLEHRKLREAMRQNANAGGLTSAEKAEMRAGLAAAIGLTPSAPVTAAPQGAATPTPPAAPAATVITAAGTSWYGKGLGALLLGMILGAGLFALLGNDSPKVIERTVGVPVQTATPSAVPFGVPEPAAGAMCDSLVTQLRDSLRILQDQAKSSTKKRSPKAKWEPKEKPTTGGSLN